MRSSPPSAAAPGLRGRCAGAPRRLAAALTLALLPAGLALAGPAAPLTLVACAPGHPGTTAEAQAAMDALAAALARVAGPSVGGLGALYLPGEAAGLARLGEPDAAVALVSLPFYLAHAGPLGLTPRLQAALAGSGALERWSLVARRGRVRRPADLAGFTVLSTAGFAPAFVRGVLGDAWRLPDAAAVAGTGQVLSALRKAAAGADVAVLLDGAQAEALASLPFAAELEVVARSAPLPVSVVATVGGRVAPPRWAALEAALLRLHAEPAGAAALAGVRMERFVPLDAAALEAARALVRGSPR